MDNLGEILRANPNGLLRVNGEHQPKKLAGQKGASFRVGKVKEEECKRREQGSQVQARLKWGPGHRQGGRRPWEGSAGTVRAGSTQCQGLTPPLCSSSVVEHTFPGAFSFFQR